VTCSGATRALSLLVLLWAVPAAAQFTVLRHENGTVEEVLPWGEYTVHFFRYGREELADVAQIQDGAGEVRFEVWDTHVLGPSAFTDPSSADGSEAQGGGEGDPSAPQEHWPTLRDLNGDGTPELRILGWSGSASCCYTEYVFDRRSTLRNVLIFRGGEYHLYKREENRPAGRAPKTDVDPLQRSGPFPTPLLVLENDAIARLNGSTHGPTAVLVLEWKGDRYVDATRRHPELPRARSFEYRDSVPLDDGGRFDLQGLAVQDLVAGYYANARLAGDGAAARAWLVSHGGLAARRWLARNGPRIDALLEQTACRFGQSQEKLLRSDRIDRLLLDVCGAVTATRIGKR
jgi:hypothetical protein